MFIRKISMIFISWTMLILLPFQDVFAEEAKEAGKAEEKGEKRELPEWMELRAQITSLEGKVAMKREAIAHLIEEKQKLPANSAQVKSIIDEMISEHKEMVKYAEDLDKKQTILKFRFPERGLPEGRKYEHIEIKPLEQMEQELGIEGRLTRNMKKARSQYGNKTQKSDEDSNENDEKEPKNVGPKSIDDQGAIILQK